MFIYQKLILKHAIFFIEKLTIIGSAFLTGTPFFLVCVLIKTSFLLEGHPN